MPIILNHFQNEHYLMLFFSYLILKCKGTNESKENGKDEKQSDEDNEEDDDDEDCGYLHPLLSKALGTAPKVQEKTETNETKTDKPEYVS
jgi:hypothetical protein